MRHGRKVSHWMWYIFPPILFPRLSEISAILLETDEKNAERVMGFPDFLKLKSSMTLFYLLSKNDILYRVLTKFYGGEFCHYTVAMVKEEGRA